MLHDQVRPAQVAEQVVDHAVVVTLAAAFDGRAATGQQRQPGAAGAAVHYFVYRGATGDGPARPGGARLALLTGGRAPAERRRQGDDDRVVNDLLRDLGRADLIVEH